MQPGIGPWTNLRRYRGPILSRPRPVRRASNGSSETFTRPTPCDRFDLRALAYTRSQCRCRGRRCSGRSGGTSLAPEGRSAVGLLSRALSAAIGFAANAVAVAVQMRPIARLAPVYRRCSSCSRFRAVGKCVCSRRRPTSWLQVVRRNVGRTV